MDGYDKHSPDVYEPLPSGLTMAFAQDIDALVRFTNLSVAEQDEIIRRAKCVRTKSEMQRLISEMSGK